ncbi:hypothetical protein [Cohnella cellulosilytica]|uniref:Alpha-L-rhamnosidase-like protein n=1 Tax=Cohnella cellulosilytica TaxID=986710 RepID=A0ABW2FDS3_9BACL
MDKQMFFNPPAAYRVLPFWFWNGDLTEEEIEWQLAEMAEKGLGGFFLCARQGMTVPYLSARWFELVRFAVTRARDLGLQAWLYDEYPYPSGMAGGEVMLRHPEAVQRKLSHHAERVSGGRRIELELPWGSVLTAKAVPVIEEAREWSGGLDLRDAIGSLQTENVYQKTGLTPYNPQRYFTYGPRKQLVWDAPEGAWDIIVVIEEQLDDFKYYGTFVDPCHDEAMKTFIDLTHRRYADELGDLLGAAVPGMFTDEIGFVSPLPWSPRIAETFAELAGAELTERLPELFYAELPDAPRIRYSYYQALHLKLRSAYHERVYEWCDERGLAYTVEVPAVRMSTLRYSHIPGGDSAHEKLGRSLSWILDTYFSSFRNNPKMTSSLSRQLGRERALNECFHSVGWSMTLQDAKWMLDRLAALGINMFNFHAFFYTIGGLNKHDAPPSQFYQNPYWRHFRQLADYAGRIGYLMSQGEADIQVAVLDPTTSLWTHMANPLHRFAYGGVEEREAARMERLKKDWAHLCNGLLKEQIDYDHLDPELLAEAEVRNGRLVIGRASYAVVALPPMCNLEHAAWRKLQAFLQAGGTVVANGLLPYEDIDGHPEIEAEMLDWFGAAESPRSNYWRDVGVSSGAEERSGKLSEGVFKGRYEAYFIPSVGSLERSGTNGRLFGRIAAAAPSALRLQVIHGKREALLMQGRRLSGGGYAVFVSNQEGEEVELQLSLALSPSGAPWAVERVSLETGEALPVALELTEAREAAGADVGIGEPGAVVAGTDAVNASAIDTGASDTGTADADATGMGSANAAVRRRRYGRLEQRLGPYESALLYFREESADSAAVAVDLPAPGKLQADAGQRFAVRALQPNALRLDKFRLTLEPSGELRDKLLSGAAAEESGEGETVEVRTIIDQLSGLSADETFPLKFDQRFGMPMRYRLKYPMECIYTASFRVDDVPEECELLLDERAISGEYRLYLNGRPIPRDELQPTRGYDCGNLACSVKHLIRPGRNVVAVALTARRDWDGLTDALYVSGSFAIGIDGGELVLRRHNGTAVFESGIPEGYENYAGELVYEGELTVTKLPEEAAFELSFAGLDPDFSDCAEVFVNGHSLGTRCWKPYVWNGKTSILQEGRNALEIRRTTVLSGMLEGRRFDYAGHRLVEALEKRA